MISAVELRQIHQQAKNERIEKELEEAEAFLKTCAREGRNNGIMGHLFDETIIELKRLGYTVETKCCGGSNDGFITENKISW